MKLLFLLLLLFTGTVWPVEIRYTPNAIITKNNFFIGDGEWTIYTKYFLKKYERPVTCRSRKLNGKEIFLSHLKVYENQQLQAAAQELFKTLEQQFGK